MLGKSRKGKLWKYALNRVNCIQCNWHNTKKILIKSIKSVKVEVLPWGLHNDYFKTEYDNIGDIALNFVKTLPGNKVKFYYPKSITFSSDHDAIVDAVNILVKNSIDNFIVYFWMGNIIDIKREKFLVEKIKKLGLTDYIKLEKHDYISYSDIKYIWSNMDVGLQIAIFDQLSSTLFEPMIVGKNVIVTDIEPYRILNSKHENIELKLINRDAQTISDEIHYYIKGNSSKKDIIRKRIEMVENHFNFDVNIENALTFYNNI